MTSRDFCYWLQGLFELGCPDSLDAHQVRLIKKHLNMVFYHEIDPSFPEEQQATLSALHGNPPTNDTDEDDSILHKIRNRLSSRDEFVKC